MFAAMAAMLVVALAVPEAFDDNAVLFGTSSFWQGSSMQPLQP